MICIDLHDGDVVSARCCPHAVYSFLQVRNEELNELCNLNRPQMGCYLPPKDGPENIEGKVGILLQAHLSR